VCSESTGYGDFTFNFVVNQLTVITILNKKQTKEVYMSERGK